jgi:aminoglycoside/choline kinase family phosphotransferase/dTDP-glucose pyrophosphorylase
MKALILAAGFGTRLLPFTQNIPKPLFTISGRPLLDIIIRTLEKAGCEAIVINTHHLHEQIDLFLMSQEYTIPISTRHEPVIRGTGGAVKNVADFWDEQPFMVINSDIFTNIDLKKVYAFHTSHPDPVTMVLCEDAEFNTVWVAPDGSIRNFDSRETGNVSPNGRRLTFTGIQVLDPEVIAYIPENAFFSIIEAYKNIIAAGKRVRSFLARGYYWKDIGTPQRYKDAVFETMAPEVFRKVGHGSAAIEIGRQRLSGDGSDRIWYRLSPSHESANSANTGPQVSGADDRRSLIMVDHGIRLKHTTSEADAFVAIGNHLFAKGIPVPKIHAFDTFSGLVFLEDLGDFHLQDMVRNAASPDEIWAYYCAVIRLLVHMSVSGTDGFDLSWTCQTAKYDRNLILEKECRYFVDSFLLGYRGLDLRYDDFAEDFSNLADKTMEFALNGFMHRDMQSRNIMVKDGQFYFIDFQGSRIGPMQYDLAALLIDPYVELPLPLQNRLSDYYIDRLTACMDLDEKRFREGYKYCTITRNLQMLGAFGHLSRVKGKTYFEKFIPPALESLAHNLFMLGDEALSKLKWIAKKLCE